MEEKRWSGVLLGESEARISCESPGKPKPKKSMKKLITITALTLTIALATPPAASAQEADSLPAGGGPTATFMQILALFLQAAPQFYATKQGRKSAFEVAKYQSHHELRGVRYQTKAQIRVAKIQRHATQ